MKTKMVFNPAMPEDIRLAKTDRALALLNNQGYKHVRPARLGSVLLRARKQLELQQIDFVALLVQRGVPINLHTLRQLEDGKSTSSVTVFFVKSLATALGITLEQLLLKAPRLKTEITKKDLAQFRTAIQVFKVTAQAEDKLLSGHCLAYTESDAKVAFLRSAGDKYKNLEILKVARVALRECCLGISSKPRKDACPTTVSPPEQSNTSGAAG